MQLVVLLDYYVSYLNLCLIKLKFIYFVDIASGSTVDWAYDVLKIPFTYTIELPPTQSKPFVFVEKLKFLFFFY